MDTSHRRDSNDLMCDDCGAWKQTKTAINHLQLAFYEDGPVKSVKPCEATFHILVLF